MANSLTRKGQEFALFGDGATGSIARKATRLKLYHSSSVPNKDGTGFIEVTVSNGYAELTISVATWNLVLVGQDQEIRLENYVTPNTDPYFEASGGTIAGIKGAYITDGTNVLAWWERASPLDLLAGERLTLDSLAIRLT